MADERVLELLRRLQALASDPGAFPAERERAAMHVSRLLAKHQLTMLDVQTARYGEDVVAQEITMTDMNAPKGHWWALLGDICRAHDCRILQHRTNVPGVGRRLVITWIGHRSDVAVGSYLFDYCWSYLNKAADADADRAGLVAYERRTYRAEYVTAAGREIGRRIRQERDGAAEESGAPLGGLPLGTALVHIKDEAVSAFVEERYPNLGTVRGPKVYHGDGSADGARTGRSMPLAKGIRSNGPTGRIGGANG